MKFKTILSIVVLAQLLACSSKTDDRPGNKVPEALSTDSKIIGSYSRNGNMVEDLYAEQKQDDPALMKLDQDIAELDQSEGDATKDFLEYNERSVNYYYSARAAANGIRDTIIRAAVIKKIDDSEAAYKRLSRDSDTLLKQINANSHLLQDERIVLKISKTMPSVESFQKNKQPTKKPMQDHILQQKKMIQNVKNKQ